MHCIDAFKIFVIFIDDIKDSLKRMDFLSSSGVESGDTSATTSVENHELVDRSKPLNSSGNRSHDKKFVR